MVLYNLDLRFDNSYCFAYNDSKDCEKMPQKIRLLIGI